jgi:HPt (histidine-containing phosphotransfer) domain-containing protein
MSEILNLETLGALREFDEPGKNDFITEIIGVYITDTQDRFKALWAAHQARDPLALSKTAHAIKGSSLNVGADGLADKMKTFEMEGKIGVLPASEKVTEAEALFALVCEELKANLDGSA